MNFTISDTMAWLSCEPVSGMSTSPFDKKSIVVKYTTVSLAEGNYTGCITISNAKREQKSIVVMLMITKPGFGLSTTTIMDTCQEGLNPNSKGFSVFNSGTGMLKFKVSANVT
jgi:hypothetical protein